MKNRFNGYGEIEYVEPEHFYSDAVNAKIIENSRDVDGDLWTIILLSDANGQRYVFSDI